MISSVKSVRHNLEAETWVYLVQPNEADILLGVRSDYDLALDDNDSAWEWINQRIRLLGLDIPKVLTWSYGLAVSSPQALCNVSMSQ